MKIVKKIVQPASGWKRASCRLQLKLEVLQITIFKTAKTQAALLAANEEILSLFSGVPSLFLDDFHAQTERKRGRLAIIGIDGYVFFQKPASPCRIHARLNLPYGPRVQVIRTNHRGCAPSGRHDTIDDQRCIPRIANFEQMTHLRPLDNFPGIISDFSGFDPGFFYVLGRQRTGESDDDRHSDYGQSLLHNEILSFHSIISSLHHADPAPLGQSPSPSHDALNGTGYNPSFF